MRTLHERAGKRHPLLLSAGELAWASVQKPIDADEGRDLARPAIGLRAVDRLEAQGEHDVFENGHVGIERVGLEYDADVPLARFDFVDTLTVEQDIATARRVDAGKHQERGGLAAAGWAEYRHEGAILDGEIDTLNRDRSQPFLADIPQLDARHDLPLDASDRHLRQIPLAEDVQE